LRGTVERRRLRLDACTQRLSSALKTYRLTHLTRIARARDRVTTFAERAERAAWTLLDNRAARLERAGQLLTAFSYRGVLSRGFALVRDGTGQPLRTAAAVQPGVPLDIEFADGRVGARAEGVSKRIESAPFARPRPRARRGSGGGGSEGQGSLFG
jgi:exodeoxyribonuclease VII large subunit